MLDKIEKEIISNRDVYILCIPVAMSKKPPKDQKACEIEKCTKCGTKIWVSLKKRNIRDDAESNKNRVNMWCALCITLFASENKDNTFEIRDISDGNVEKI